MKACIAGSIRRDGSVLMVTLFSAVLIGTVLASYLTLIRHQDVAVARSQGWNAALAMAEAGVEEALAQMNAGATNSSFDLSANGWGPPSASGNFNLQSRTLPGGRERYDVKFFTNSASSSPTIYSTGYVTIPALSATLERKIKVSTKGVPLINVAVAAKYGFTMASGSGFSADSFNSTEPTHSDNGRYPSSYPSRILTNGDVASVYGPVNFGANPSIKGDLYLGPAVTGGADANQVSGKIYRDLNVDYPDVAAPLGAPNGPGWFQAPLDDGITHEFTTSGTFWVNDSSNIVVTLGLNGNNVVLYVRTTNFSPASIQIEASGSRSSTLKIYQLAGTAKFNEVRVDSRRAENFWYYGMPGVTSVTYDNDVNANFFGVIYAPSADLHLRGGWGSGGWGMGMNLVGACIARTITVNGYYNFHFDENLLAPNVGPVRCYVASGWKELTQPGEL